MQTSMRPFSFSAGAPYIVVSSTSGSRMPMARTVANVMTNQSVLQTAIEIQRFHLVR
jgi:hypothetical protein